MPTLKPIITEDRSPLGPELINYQKLKLSKIWTI